MTFASPHRPETVVGVIPTAEFVGLFTPTADWAEGMESFYWAEGTPCPHITPGAAWYLYRMPDPDFDSSPIWAEDIWKLVDGFEVS